MKDQITISMMLAATAANLSAAAISDDKAVPLLLAVIFAGLAGRRFRRSAPQQA